MGFSTPSPASATHVCHVVLSIHDKHDLGKTLFFNIKPEKSMSFLQSKSRKIVYLGDKSQGMFLFQNLQACKPFAVPMIWQKSILV